jgi:hypothetical protein
MKRVAVLDANLYGLAACGDVNGNGLKDISSIIPWNESLVVFEHAGDNLYRRLSPHAYLLKVDACGDGDSDSLGDIIALAIPDSGPDYWVCLFESPSPGTLPSRIVWRVAHDGIYHFSQYLDLDSDGRRELAIRFAWGIQLFECAGDDSFSLVNTFLDYGPTYGRFCACDFDRDGRIEMAAGNAASRFVVIWEATGNDNEYQLRYVDTTETEENLSTCAPGDLNGNGWPELVVVGMGYDVRPRMMVYEAYGNDQYHRIWEAPCNYFDSPIAAGDVDGDGVNELAMAGGSATIYKWDGSNYSPIWTFPDSSVGSMNLYDLNGNGRAEIILALPTHTSIYEDCSPGVAEFAPHPKTAPTRAATIVRSPFRFEPLEPQSAIEVYSVDGKLVARQQSGNLGAWTWDLRDQTGRPVPAGTYLAVIRSRSQTQQLKLCVVR